MVDAVMWFTPEIKPDKNYFENENYPDNFYFANENYLIFVKKYNE